MYLFRSVVWLTGFALVYFLFLRPERFFMLKRFYLIAGIFFSIGFPLITIHYQVELPVPDTSLAEYAGEGISGTGIMAEQGGTDKVLEISQILLILYGSGVLFFLFRLARHIYSVVNVIGRSEIEERGKIRLIRTSEFRCSFSFFNYVFINPSVDENEAEEVINHELVHVSQRHWFDLLLLEIMRIFQWANPVIWVYTGFIRQNHEYLADEAALQRSANPAIYRAALVNQLFSAPVFSLSNSFNYSLNKKRFDMMKKIITSPYRRMKVLLVLPVIGMVLYAFAAPEYHYAETAGDATVINSPVVTYDQQVRGVVFKENNTPFQGVSILVIGKPTAAITDASGNFVLGDVPDDAFLVFSSIGYLTRMEKVQGREPMKIVMEIDPLYKEPVGKWNIDGTAANPLIVIDGVISEKGSDGIDMGIIESVSVLKSGPVIASYGEKGKNGVILITTKTRRAVPANVPFRRSKPEDFPTFREGTFESFNSWLTGKVKYPPEALTKKAEGWVQISFTVAPDGTVTDVKSTGVGDPLLTEAVAQVVRSSPKWEPAINPEARVPFQNAVTLNFRLPGQIKVESPFVIVEKMPEYKGGNLELRTFVKNNIRYPEEARARKIEGKVIILFVVTDEGKVEGVSVLGGVDPLLDAEAVRVVSSLTDFSPGMQNGKPVNVWYNVPVTFSLSPEPEPKVQAPPKAVTEKDVFVVVEEMPVYPGGNGALLEFINQNISYPEEAKRLNIQGKVIVSFIVTKEGNVSGIKVERGVHPLLDKEAERVTSLLTGFIPGKQGGKPVGVYYTVPITFTL